MPPVVGGGDWLLRTANSMFTENLLAKSMPLPRKNSPPGKQNRQPMVVCRILSLNIDLINVRI
jgi:hypothetical protein